MKKILLLLLFSLVLLPSLAEAQFPDSLKQYFWRRDGKWAIPSATDTSGQFIWRTFGGLNQSDSIIFYDTTGIAWHRDGHKITAIVTPDTSRLFLWSISGGVTRKDSIRFYDTTGIHWVNNGHGLTAVISVTATPAPPDSAIQRDSAGVLAADFHFLWERFHQAVTTKGAINDPSGLPVVGGKVYTDFVIGSIANNGLLTLAGNFMSEPTGHAGKIVFGSQNLNTQNFYDDNGYTWKMTRDSTGVASALALHQRVNNRINTPMASDEFFSTSGNFSQSPTYQSLRSYGIEGTPNIITGVSPSWHTDQYMGLFSGFLYKEVAGMFVFGDGNVQGSKILWNTTRSGGTQDSTTLALRSDGSVELGRLQPVIVSGYGGNVTMPGTAQSNKDTSQTVSNSFGPVQPYKVYVAILTQTSTSAPVATVLQNTLGGSVVWARTGTGTFTGTLSGAFTVNKTYLPNDVMGGALGTGVFQMEIDITRTDANTVTISTGNSAGDPTDGIMNTFPYSLEIRVYP